MRRLLVVAVAAAACVTAAPAYADPCEPDGGGCHPNDCMEYDPVREAEQLYWALRTGDPAAVQQALDSCF